MGFTVFKYLLCIIMLRESCNNDYQSINAFFSLYFILVCSAGVGRSGTFITLLSQLKQIEAENNVDVFGFVRSMRYQRCYMVQTEVSRLHTVFISLLTTTITY